MRSAALSRVIPLVIASSIPFGVASCTSEDPGGNGTGGMSSGASGGTGGSSGSATGGSTSGSAGQATGGSSATGGTGGSSGGGGTGGSTGGASTGGAGASTGGSAGRASAGMGGMGTAGGGQGGAATGGASSGGASSGGMGAGGAATGGAASGGAPMGGAGGGSSGGTFALTSPNHMDGAKFDPKYTCASGGGQLGQGAIPELDWAGVPAGTKSFAITFIDTTLGDTSPMGQHWAIWNIPWDGTKVNKIAEGMTMLSGDLAMAKQSGKFLSPCAQSLMNNMDDQYEFTIYALSTDTLNVQGSSVANALTALKAATASTLGTAKLKGHAGLKGG